VALPDPNDAPNVELMLEDNPDSTKRGKGRTPTNTAFGVVV
jgi:hypothetical protein